MLNHDRGYEKVAHLYDLFDRKKNIAFFAHYASATGEILDIGAGTGRIAIPSPLRGAAEERGIKVYCVEPSPAMRGEFEKKLAQRPDLVEHITLIAGDARSFDFGRTFPAAFLSGSFDHFLDDEERLSSLRNIARHLDPNGKLIFDVFLGLMRDSPLSPTGTVQVGSREHRRFVATRVLPNQIQEARLVFGTYRDGELLERLEERGLVGVIDREKLHQLLAQAGFEVRQEFSDYDFAPFEKGSPLLIVEAEKLGTLK